MVKICYGPETALNDPPYGEADRGADAFLSTTPGYGTRQICVFPFDGIQRTRRAFHYVPYKV
jgi:hypothetical protein